MSEVNKIIREVKSNSNVDNFTSNLEKAFEDMVANMIEDVRTHKTTTGDVNFCSFHQETIAKELSDKYLKD